MNSGFGPGAPRNDAYRGVQEGRERGGFLPRLKGVGRLGRPPVKVPEKLAEAAREKPEETTLRRFEELRVWMVDMDRELMRSSLADEGPQPFVLNSIRRDLYAVQAEWQKAYNEMHGEQCSDLEGKIEEYKVGPELYHRAAVGAIREDILAYNRAYGKVKYSKEEMATHQRQLTGMNVALERIPGPLPGERKARVFLKYSSMAEHSEQLDVAERLEKLSTDLDIDEGSVSQARRNDAVLRVRNPGKKAEDAPIKATRQVAEAIRQNQKTMLREESVLRMFEVWVEEIKRLEQEVEDRDAISTSTATATKRLDNVKLDLEALRGEIRKLVANGTHLKGGQGSLEGERRYQRARRIALIKELLKFDDEVRLADGEEHGLQSYTTKEGHPNSLRQLLQDYEESALADKFPLYR